MLAVLLVAIRDHLRRVFDPAESDRGDSPVSTTIIIAGLAILATAVVAWAGTRAIDYMNSAPVP